MFILDGWRTLFHIYMYRSAAQFFGHFRAHRNFRFWLLLNGLVNNLHPRGLHWSSSNFIKMFILDEWRTLCHIRVNTLHPRVLHQSSSNFIKMFMLDRWKNCFILECCPNFLCTFWHLKISDFDFVTEWPCEHSSIEGIAPIMVKLHQNVILDGWRTLFHTAVLPQFLGPFGHLEISDFDFVTEWSYEHSTPKGIALIIKLHQNVCLGWMNNSVSTLYTQGDGTDHHQTSSQCLSWMSEDTYVISECCPNFLGTFRHLEFSYLDFVVEWPCEQSIIKGIAPIMVKLH